jgi:hypothetical protein
MWMQIIPRKCFLDRQIHKERMPMQNIKSVPSYNMTHHLGDPMPP